MLSNLNRKLFLIGFLSFTLFSCNKELDLYEKTKQHCRENMEFTCAETLGEFYFKGILNGTEFCISKGINDYWMLNDITTISVTPTENPVLNQEIPIISSFYSFGFYPPIKDHWNGLSEDFSPRVYIQTPYIQDTVIYSPTEYLDRFIKAGDLILRDGDMDEADGFNFQISWGCVLLPGYDHYYEEDPYKIPVAGEIITPSRGFQKNSVFRVSEFKKTVLPDFFVYDITFEISCDLYRGSDSTDRKFFGRLEEGEFKTQVLLTRDG